MQFHRSKSNLNEDGLRMPHHALVGGNINKGRRIEDIITLTDIAPTFLETVEIVVVEFDDHMSLVHDRRSDLLKAIVEG